MKIALLSFRRNFLNYENTAFKNNALKKGINLSLIDPDECDLYLRDEKIEVYNNDKLLPKYDYILVRVGCMINTHVRHVINTFKLQGATVSIEANDVSLIADKFGVHIVMNKIGVKTINSIKSRDLKDLNLNYPVVFKSNTGSLGLGIYKADDRYSLENLINHSKLLDNKYDYIIQDFIKESFGIDLRLFVVNGQIIKVMKRQSDGEDFKANYSLHNTAETFEINDKLIKIVDKIYDEINADILGIDLLFYNDDYLVCEINSAPGFKGLEKVYPGLNIAGIILDNITKEVH